MGSVAGNDNTEISGITLKNFDVTVKDGTLRAAGVTGLSVEMQW